MIKGVMIMKKISDKLTILMLVLLFLFCTIYPEETKNAASAAISRCLGTVIPSLYAMMIVSGLLTNSRIIDSMGRFTEKAGKIFFGMEKTVFPVFLLSMFAGYPIGARMLCSEYENGHISKNRTQWLTGICFGAGSAFISGCIASGIYKSRSVSLLIFTSNVGANVVSALVMSLFSRKNTENISYKTQKPAVNTIMLMDTISSAGKALAEICFSVTAFAIISAALEKLGIIEIFGNILAHSGGHSEKCMKVIVMSVLDITAISGLPECDYTLLPCICGLVSFGGICVIFQVMTAVKGRISLLPFIFMRTVSAVLSYCICRLILPHFILNESITVSAVRIHKEGSFIPSILLMLMTFIVCREVQNIKKAV